MLGSLEARIWFGGFFFSLYCVGYCGKVEICVCFEAATVIHKI